MKNNTPTLDHARRTQPTFSPLDKLTEEKLKDAEDAIDNAMRDIRFGSPDDALIRLAGFKYRWGLT